MPEQQVYLHYMNINVEGTLPHALNFAPIYGRLVTEDQITGQVVTVVSFGMPRRYFVWSTFAATMRVKEVGGKTVVQGDGWQLCPPREVPEKNINYLVQGNIRDHLFIHIIDPRVVKWLLYIANRYKPPGDPYKLRTFLRQMMRDVGNEKIETKIAKLLKTVKIH